MSRQRIIHMLLTAFLIIFVSGSAAAQDLLPSWNAGSAKTAILEFVTAVTDENGKDFVKPAERIAVFMVILVIRKC